MWKVGRTQDKQRNHEEKCKKTKRKAGLLWGKRAVGNHVDLQTVKSNDFSTNRSMHTIYIILNKTWSEVILVKKVICLTFVAIGCQGSYSVIRYVHQTILRYAASSGTVS